MRQIVRDRAELAELIVHDKPTMRFVEALDIVDKLGRAATTLHRLNLHDCNTRMSDADRKRHEAAKMRAARAAIRIVDERLGSDFKLRLDSDPRGFPIYLGLPSGRSNSLGGEGWGVPYASR